MSGDVEVSACRLLVNPWRIEVSSKTKISSGANGERRIKKA
jgi:hypothetical protein